MNMIERVALSIIHADQIAVEAEIEPTSQNWAMLLAAAAIQAMRDPTPEMIEAGEAVDGTVTALPIWQAMIDAVPIETYEMEPIDTSFGVGEG